MTVSKSATFTLGLSALAVVTALAVAPASAAPFARGLSPLASMQDQLVHQVQWRRHHGHHHGYHRGSRGGAVAAGVLGGLALGAAIGAAGAYAPPPPVYYEPAPAYGGGGGDWIAYCSSKYRSFDPASGTYLGYDGLRHPCQ